MYCASKCRESSSTVLSNTCYEWGNLLDEFGKVMRQIGAEGRGEVLHLHTVQDGWMHPILLQNVESRNVNITVTKRSCTQRRSHET
jgi:hypothetical protein